MVFRFGFEVVLHGRCFFSFHTLSGKNLSAVDSVFVCALLPYLVVLLAEHTQQRSSHSMYRCSDGLCFQMKRLVELRFLVFLGRVDLWNNENLAQDVFLGETRVPVKILRSDHIHKAW